MKTAIFKGVILFCLIWVGITSGFQALVNPEMRQWKLFNHIPQSFVCDYKLPETKCIKVGYSFNEVNNMLDKQDSTTKHECCKIITDCPIPKEIKESLIREINYERP